MLPARFSAVVLFGFGPAFPAQAEVTEISPGDDVRAAIANLGPGDELVLSGGVYGFDSRFNISVVGEPDSPAIIRGKAGEQAIIEMNTGSQNVLEIQGSAHLVLRGLTFRGGSHGIRLMDSDFITVEDCEIYETGDVALSAPAARRTRWSCTIRSSRRATASTCATSAARSSSQTTPCTHRPARPSA